METTIVNLTIDGVPLAVPHGTTVLDAAAQIGVHIPTLCYMKGVNHSSGCRMCLVEVGPRLIASCTLVAEDGMNIRTNSTKVRNARRTTLELLLSDHNRECTSCLRSGTCELQDAAETMHIRGNRFAGDKARAALDASSPSVMRDTSKCVLCGRCVAACGTMQTVHAIGFANRGFATTIGPAYGRDLADSPCVNCGQCVLACPTGALQEREHITDVWRSLADPTKYVVVQTAPAVRVALGEEFGMPLGTRVTGRMVAALRRLGFHKVFDTDFAADLTIMEEGTELLSRLNSGASLPLMTSCCPGWVKFIEHQYPDMLEHLSTCKSPHEMEGAIIKSYFAEQEGIDPASIVVVSIMPCTAKKFECEREELAQAGLPDVDYVLTTRELARMIREAGLDFARLAGEPFDNPFGEATGAGVIFGATGGVAEAALRTVYEIVSGQELTAVEFHAVRGLDGIKESAVELPGGRVIKTAVVHGLGQARKLIEMIRAGEKELDFIEVMACPGGCVAGGGQPFVNAREVSPWDIRMLRAKAIYAEDEAQHFRKSHQNPYIKKLYDDFLGEPNGHLSHELLHTRYIPRKRF